MNRTTMVRKTRLVAYMGQAGAPEGTSQEGTPEMMFLVMNSSTVALFICSSDPLDHLPFTIVNYSLRARWTLSIPTSRVSFLNVMALDLSCQPHSMAGHDSLPTSIHPQFSASNLFKCSSISTPLDNEYITFFVISQSQPFDAFIMWR